VVKRSLLQRRGNTALEDHLQIQGSVFTSSGAFAIHKIAFCIPQWNLVNTVTDRSPKIGVMNEVAVLMSKGEIFSPLAHTPLSS